MKQLLGLITAVFAMTVLQGVVQAEDKREKEPRFKGVELYSWKDKENNWMYVLAEGSNAQKTEKEIREEYKAIKGTAELKKALALVAEKEQVFWSNHRLSGFEFPPEGTRKEIEKAAKEAKIELTILK